MSFSFNSKPSEVVKNYSQSLHPKLSVNAENISEAS